MRGKRSIYEQEGFTLIEALLSMTILALSAGVISAMYIGGLHTLNAQGDRTLLMSQVRSRMELALSEPFASMVPGTLNVTIGGSAYTIDTTIVAADLDGDTNPEVDAKQVTVTVAELPVLSLTVLVADPGNQVGKI